MTKIGKTMNPIAIIPARGGSKRLPRKNILEVDGKPLLVHTINTALESKTFNQVYVSTEDEEIASIADHAGAEVIIRPDDLASDTASVKDVCLHLIDVISAQYSFEHFCVMTATSILREAKDIHSSYELLQKGFDFVTSVCSYFFYPHAAIVVNSSGQIEYQWPDIALSKGQELPEFVVENGSLNWCKTDVFLEKKCFIAENTATYHMPKYKSIDVDTEEDFIALKAMYFYLKYQVQS